MKDEIIHAFFRGLPAKAIRVRKWLNEKNLNVYHVIELNIAGKWRPVKIGDNTNGGYGYSCKYDADGMRLVFVEYARRK